MDNQRNILLPKNKYKPWLASFILFVSDLISISLSFFVAYLLRVSLLPSLGGIVNIKMLAPFLYLLYLLIIGLFIANGLYPGSKNSAVVELRQIITSVSISFVILGLVIYFFGFGNQISRFIFIVAWLFCCSFILTLRLFIHNRCSLFSWWAQPIVVIGKEKDVTKIISEFNQVRRFALKPVVGLILNSDFVSEQINGVTVFPNSINIQQKIREYGIKLAVFVTSSDELNTKQKEQIYELSLSFPDLIYMIGESTLSSSSMKPLDLSGSPAVQVHFHLLNPFVSLLKRLIDLIICILISLFTLPLFLVLAIFIHFDSPGPIIYKQQRIGKDEKIFTLYKFRTMYLDAEAKLEELLMNNELIREEYDKFHKIQNDPRITRVGRFLRKHSLDELPQVWNVLIGEMSFVGPRAYMPSEIDQMGDSLKLITRVLPGLTGWWQVMGRHDVSFKKRLLMDQYYIINFSLWMDFYILLKTVWVVISGQGE